MAPLWPRKILIGAALIVAGCAATLIYRANRGVDESMAEVRQLAEIRFSERVVDRSPALFERIAANAGFRDAALYRENLYVLTATELREYDGKGTYLRSFATGVELPPAPLSRLAVGLSGAAGGPLLYIATDGEGLVSFDGNVFRSVRTEDARFRRITALLALSTGELLIGTQKAGVMVWDGSGFRWLHDGLKNIPVTALAGELQNLWVGTMDRGVLHFHAGQTDGFGDGVLADSHVLSLAVAGDAAYVGTALGVAEFRSGKFQRSLAEGSFASALLVTQNTLLVGTLEEGIAQVALQARQPRPNPLTHGIESRQVERLIDVGKRPCAVFRDRVALLEPGSAQWTSVATPPEAVLTDTNIAALAVEGNGRLWVGYFDRGLDVLAPGSERAVHREDDTLFCINRIVPRRDGAVIATANGLAFTDATGKLKRTLTRTEGLIATHVTDVVVDDQSIVAATPAGLTFLGPAGAQSIYAFHGLVNNHVYALGQNGGMLVAGTLGGISVLENGVVKANFTTANSALRHNWISALVHTGSDWFAGTYGAGVYRYDGAAWHSFPEWKGGAEINPNAMLATETGIYAGTLNRGLAKYSRETGRWNLVTSGLPSANVTALAAVNGTLFVGTENGLVRIPERSLP